jgi:Holliday junction resolvasome RuvABC endonuclease subunit
MIVNTQIKLVGFDPALRNFGIAKATYDLSVGKIEFHDLKLVETEKQTNKVVRQNSDDLRRCRDLYKGMVEACEGQHFAIAEIPTGTQSARGMFSNGSMLGILSACPIPLIEVLPHEVKLAAVGHRQAAKEEMIEWAMTKYPHLPWLTRKSKGALVPVNANEHLADAVATIHAGVITQQFQQSISVFRILRG